MALLVNPVPVSAARALGAEIVIACNVSTDVFGHGTIISAHGKRPAEVEVPAEPVVEKRGFGKFFSAEKTVKREFFGSASRPGISTVMVEAFNIMQDRITRSRLAGDPPDVLISPAWDASDGSTSIVQKRPLRTGFVPPSATSSPFRKRSTCSRPLLASRPVPRSRLLPRGERPAVANGLRRS